MIMPTPTYKDILLLASNANVVISDSLIYIIRDIDISTFGDPADYVSSNYSHLFDKLERLIIDVGYDTSVATLYCLDNDYDYSHLDIYVVKDGYLTVHRLS